ncbi:GIY-YIG nuclease family protein [Pelagerythrobacter sp.]|uniref:GIY-YIG nuclease family protein n=1 Tax=Pelagerythrobacter sp. TaxID=2800702 RepID=UPI0035B19EFA
MIAGEDGGWVYIMTNEREGVLYIGVTSDLAARIRQHRTDETIYSTVSPDRERSQLSLG